jgi:hypothetical protein
LPLAVRRCGERSNGQVCCRCNATNDVPNRLVCHDVLPVVVGRSSPDRRVSARIYGSRPNPAWSMLILTVTGTPARGPGRFRGPTRCPPGLPALAPDQRCHKGIGAAITLHSLACKGRMTRLRLEPSAQLPFNRRYCTSEANTRLTRSPLANGLTEPAGRSTMSPQRRGLRVSTRRLRVGMTSR